MLEKTFKKMVLADLKTLPGTHHRKIQQLATHGTPDVLVCCQGFAVDFELKRDEKEKPTELQKYELGKTYASGGIGFVAHPQNWAHLFGCLHELVFSGNKQRAHANLRQRAWENLTAYGVMGLVKD